jgi:hypothetical protein
MNGRPGKGDAALFEDHDIDNAGNKLDLGRILISKMPGAV